jgi:hypothetical protein
MEVLVHPLIFIDTNILLDFYRIPGRESDLSILKLVDANRQSFITTSQVEMEFQKNRPTVILETYRIFKDPDAGSGQLPAFLSNSKQSKALARTKAEAARLQKAMKSRIGKVFNAPAVNDLVYQTARRLFRSTSPYNLNRASKQRFGIRRLAFKRWLLGYPPRKNSDTSIGDAINWEWIIDVANASGQDIVIASRDSDYGARFGDSLYLNDWLRHEFKERVSRRRRIHLVERLSDALKLASIKVSKKAASAEATLTATAPTLTPSSGSFGIPTMSQKDLLSALFTSLGLPQPVVPPPGSKGLLSPDA